MDTFTSQSTPAIFEREFEGMFCRIIIGRYASDIKREWQIPGSYNFGHLVFGEFLYIPTELTLETMNSMLMFTSMIKYSTPNTFLSYIFNY